jgi:hypothetical protein
MCTLRAGYTAQVLSKLWREVITVCGKMDGKWHARNILKSPSGREMIYDPMNPKMDQKNYPFVNAKDIGNNEYNQLKNGKYIWSLMMMGHDYDFGLN